MASPMAIATSARATATPSATAAAAATPAAGSAAPGLGLVDAEGTAHQFSALQGFDRPILHLGIRHLHEGETPLATRIPLQGKGAVQNVAEGRKQFSHIFLLSTEGKIANKDAHEADAGGSGTGPGTAQA